MDCENNIGTDKSFGVGHVMEIAEGQIIGFPIIVTILTCVSFFFGGHCAAWQWWASLLLVLTSAFIRRGRRRQAAGACLLFVGFLFFLRFLLSPMMLDKTNIDMMGYHLPQIRLLVEGWNPIQDPQAERITSTLGLDMWGMGPLHVAFTSKTMAIFSAVACFFIGDPDALTFPGVFFLWAACALTCRRVFHGLARWAAWLTLATVAWNVPDGMYVDRCLALASFGLLCTMSRDLSRKGCDWWRLGAYGFWMTTIKLNGTMAAAIFFTLFALAKLWRQRKEHPGMLATRFTFLAAWLALSLAVVAFNPLGTSWKDFGHPLYPWMTIDAQRFPVKDITCDLQFGNDDATKAGRTALVLNAYVSPTVARMWAKWTMGEDDFRPYRLWWDNGMGLKRAESPIRWINRLWIWITFAILLAFGTSRCLGMGGLALLLVVSPDKIGYLRYQPWLWAMAALAVVLAVEYLGRRWRRVGHLAVCGFAVTFVLPQIIHGAWMLTRQTDVKMREECLIRERIHPAFYCACIPRESKLKCKGFAPRWNFLTCMSNECALRIRQRGWSEHTTILPMAGLHVSRQSLIYNEGEPAEVLAGDGAVPWSTTDILPGLDLPMEVRGGEVEMWSRTPFGYCIPLGDGGDAATAYSCKFAGGPRAKLEVLLNTWFREYPMGISRRLHGIQKSRQRQDTSRPTAPSAVAIRL